MRPGIPGTGLRERQNLSPFQGRERNWRGDGQGRGA